MAMKGIAALTLFGLANIFDSVSAVGQHYKPHDPVFIVANKVGPFNNPSETFEVFNYIFFYICFFIIFTYITCLK